MTEKPSDPEQSVPPEDIAGLYARARTPESTYWDFSASRKEVLGHFRHRIARKAEALRITGHRTLQDGRAVEPVEGEEQRRADNQRPQKQLALDAALTALTAGSRIH